jgi:AcrR family transcriptional regulator
VEAAFELIGARGFEGLRLRDVAAAAGIDHSTVHHYFATKEDLVAAVVDHATRQFWSTMPLGGSPADEIGAHLRVLGRMARERPALFVVLRELDLRARRDPAVRAILADRERGWRDALSARLAGDATATALVIAAVKGASFDPEAAGPALALLGRLLTEETDR